MSNISPQAIIEDGAKIGENVSIAPFCLSQKMPKLAIIQQLHKELRFMEKQR